MGTSALPPGDSNLTSKYQGCVNPTLSLEVTESFVLEKTQMDLHLEISNARWLEHQVFFTALLLWIMHYNAQGSGIRFISICQCLRKSSLLHSLHNLKHDGTENAPI
jgi:hypothetical protein